MTKDHVPIGLELQADVVRAPLAPPPILGGTRVRAASVCGVASIEHDLDALRAVVLVEIDVELKLVPLDDDQRPHVSLRAISTIVLPQAVYRGGERILKHFSAAGNRSGRAGADTPCVV